MSRFLEVVLSLALAGAVLAFGGVQPITYSLVELVLFSSLIWLLLKQTSQGKISLPLPLWPLLFVLLVVAQVVPLPPELVSKLSPARLPGPALLGSSDAHSLWTTLSVYPHDTVVALLKLLAYLSAFLLAAYLFDSRTRKSLLVRVLILLGCFEAAYGIFQYLTHTDKIFTYKKIYYLGIATGTYINRNHYAGFLEETIPFLVTAIFYSYQLGLENDSRPGSRRAPPGKRPSIPQMIFLLFLLAMMVIAVIFSYSRGGILSTVSSLVLMGLLAGLRTKQRVWMIGVVAFLACVLGYGIWIGLDPVMMRFEQMREPGFEQTSGRFDLWKSELPLIREHALLGTGLGTFAVVYPRYQNTLVDQHVDHAHCDYLEFAAETGLVGVALFFLPILYLWGRMIVSFFTDTRRFRRSVTLGCIGSASALLLHSFTDFNLQIPANALVFAVVLGLGYKAACIERREEAPSFASVKVNAVPVATRVVQ